MQWVGRTINHLRVLGLELPSTSFRTSQDQQTVRLNIDDVDDLHVGDAGSDEESSWVRLRVAEVGCCWGRCLLGSVFVKDSSVLSMVISRLPGRLGILIERSSEALRLNLRKNKAWAAEGQNLRRLMCLICWKTNMLSTEELEQSRR